MHWKNGMAQGFALFAHGAAASQAIQTVNGLVFDDGVVSRTHLLHIMLCSWICICIVWLRPCMTCHRECNSQVL